VAEPRADGVENVAQIVAGVSLVGLGPQEREDTVTRATEVTRDGEQRKERLGAAL
jgi:hypothetical protein